MSSSPPPRVGIIGLGNIGRFHADRLVDHGVDLAGGVDIDPDVRNRFADAYATDTYETASDLFAVADAVIVATPNRFHEEYAVDALEHDVHVLLEKPLAHSIESAEGIVAAAEASDGFVMTGFKNRFANPVEVIKSFQEQGRFGTTRHVEANYIRRRGIPGRGSWFTSQATSGGGSLIDIGIHAIDLALHFLDFPEVVEVSATTRSAFGAREDYAYIDMWGEDLGPGGFDVDDSVSAFIRCADGSTVSLEAAWATNRPTNHEFLVRGTDAGACFDRQENSLKLYESSKEGVDHLADTDVTTRSNDAMAAEQRAFLDAVERGESPERNTLEEGLAVQRVIDAIYRSSEAGRAIRLDDATQETPVEID
ncbi:Gfo/Idh/MocA family protein [Halococcus agarilyticus]|uniref:Gfo/Idh/MocA family protein n=1 Tax=Halococcus agarilyticus TaxID=1232219 RepID=UPI0006779864|nr:Gfo/Idh/MocA family oxidoreductase [Halococcus agarilyticus]